MQQLENRAKQVTEKKRHVMCVSSPDNSCTTMNTCHFFQQDTHVGNEKEPLIFTKMCNMINALFTLHINACHVDSSYKHVKCLTCNNNTE